MRPILGYALAIGALIYSIYMMLPQMKVAYVRWPDIASTLGWTMGMVYFFLLPVAGYTAAALSAPRVLTASGIGTRPLKLQLLGAGVILATIVFVALVAGQIPAIIRAIANTHTFSAFFALDLLAACLFLIAGTALATLLGVALARFHPIISALVNLAIAYIIVATLVNINSLWAFSPLSNKGEGAITYAEANVPGFSINAAFSLGLAGLFWACLWGITTLSTSGRSSRAGLAAYASAVMVVAIGLGVQALLGSSRPLVNKDICATTAGGNIEVCVDRADEPGLPKALSDVEAFLALIPDRAPSMKFAELNSYSLRSDSTIGEDWQWFTTNNPGRRIDVTPLAREIMGINNCTSPVAEPTMTTERFATYLIKQAGVYSKNVEKYGALYMSANENGETEQVPDILTSQGDPAKVREYIKQHWEQIHSCTGNYAMLDEAVSP